MRRFPAQTLRAVFNPRCAITGLVLACLLSIAPASASADDPPELDTFTASHFFGDWWLFEGTFQDESPKNCVIEFGGLLDGESVKGDYDGTFVFLFNMSSLSYGIVSAQVRDSADQTSNVLEDFVDP